MDSYTILAPVKSSVARLAARRNHHRAEDPDRLTCCPDRRARDAEPRPVPGGVALARADAGLARPSGSAVEGLRRIGVDRSDRGLSSTRPIRPPRSFSGWWPSPADGHRVSRSTPMVASLQPPRPLLRASATERIFGHRWVDMPFYLTRVSQSCSASDTGPAPTMATTCGKLRQRRNSIRSHGMTNRAHKTCARFALGRRLTVLVHNALGSCG
jgi:hypothetical protein